MNAREEARRMAEVMLAFADGADVQYRLPNCSDVWDDTGVPDWNWRTWDYRVKPKPREEWQVANKYGAVLRIHKSADAAQSYADEHARSDPLSAPFRIVHMREVTE